MCGITGHRDIYVTFTELEVWSVTISRYLTIFDSCKYSLIAVVIKTTAIDLRFKSELKIRLIEHRWHLLSFKIKRVGMGGLLPTWPRSFTVSSIFFLISIIHLLALMSYEFYKHRVSGYLYWGRSSGFEQKSSNISLILGI